jgi:GR25 family glycosyltransferase involved in LPS biosynthesis
MRSFCITLPETPERTDAAKKHFSERSVRVEFFNGIHGETMGLRTIFCYDATQYCMGPKHIGCWLSHYMIWQALTIAAGDVFMILEDDVKFCDDWHIRLNQAMKDVPDDFDVLFIGSCCCEDKPKTQINGEVWEVKWPFCNHAYVVARKALPIMLETQRKCYTQMDISLYHHTWPKLKVYTVLPRIADQFNMELAI